MFLTFEIKVGFLLQKLFLIHIHSGNILWLLSIIEFLESVLKAGMHNDIYVKHNLLFSMPSTRSIYRTENSYFINMLLNFKAGRKDQRHNTVNSLFCSRVYIFTHTVHTEYNWVMNILLSFRQNCKEGSTAG